MPGRRKNRPSCSITTLRRDAWHYERVGSSYLYERTTRRRSETSGSLVESRGIIDRGWRNAERVTRAISWDEVCGAHTMNNVPRFSELRTISLGLTDCNLSLYVMHDVFDEIHFDCPFTREPGVPLNSREKTRFSIPLFLLYYQHVECALIKNTREFICRIHWNDNTLINTKKISYIKKNWMILKIQRVYSLVNKYPTKKFSLFSAHIPLYLLLSPFLSATRRYHFSGQIVRSRSQTLAKITQQSSWRIHVDLLIDLSTRSARLELLSLSGNLAPLSWD